MNTASGKRRTAKLFANGASQAVRLPAKFRFQGTEVFIDRNPETGAVVLTPKVRSSWTEFTTLRDKLHAALVAEGSGDYQPGREAHNDPVRDPFVDDRE